MPAPVRRAISPFVDTLDFAAKAYRDALVIEGGILRDQCAALYYRPWDKIPQADHAEAAARRRE